MNVYIGLLGFGLTFWGLSLTLQTAKQARQNAIDATDMARAAKEAADSAALRIAKYDLISDVSAASGLAEEIRRCQNQGDWSPLPDRSNRLSAKVCRVS